MLAALYAAGCNCGGTPVAPDGGGGGAKPGATCADGSLTCGDNAYCKDSATGPACACMNGFQDNDGNGSCTAACGPASCGGHGTCTDASGTATCSCSAGYQGAQCAQCAAGFQDRDMDGVCKAACSASTCGDAGACDDASGEVACSCPGGRGGLGCTRCAAGFQDNDMDGTCRVACSASPCGPSATCSDTTGRAVCTCAAGTQDNDRNDTCTPTCATAMLACGPSSVCGDATGTARCECATGFVADGGACAWAGVVQDPEFVGTPAAAWSTTGAGSLSPQDGQFIITAPGRCERGFSLSQRVRLPPASLRVPLALTLTSPSFSTTLLATLGDQAGQVGYSQPLCLGEGALGGEQLLTLRSPPAFNRTCSPQEVRLDSVTIAPSNGCPLPGQVFNGTFELDGGWSEGAYSAVVDGGASRVLRLSKAGPCLQAESLGTVSVPARAATEGVALQFTARGDAGTPVDVVFGFSSAVLGTARVTNAPVRVCVPSSLAGGAYGLGFALQYGACPGPATSVDIDDVSLVADPSCAGRGAIANASFEAGDFGGWATGDGQTGAAVSFEVRTATMTEPAHHGTKYARISSSACGYGYLSQVFRVPPSGATGGPALSLWYRSSHARDNVTVESTNGGTLAIADLLSDIGWTQHVQCLPPQLVGQSLQTYLSLGSFACAMGVSRTLDLDDVQLTTDTSCPR